METIIILVILAVLLMPIIAMVMANTAQNEARNLKTSLQTLEAKAARLEAQISALQSGQSLDMDANDQDADQTTKTSQATSAATSGTMDDALTADADAAPAKEPIAIAAASASGERISEAAPNASAPEAAPTVSAPNDPPKRYIFTEENKSRFSRFIREYWLYILGALTLALSGIYLVRWGIENGFVPPILRVLFALGLGAGLLYVAERFREKWGDEEGSTLEYMPSSIAAAGVTTLYAAVFGAYSLYGLIGSSTAFLAMMFIAIGTIVAGLRFGLLLSALGVLGAYITPFMVGGGTGREYLLFGYSLLIMVAALVVDSFRRSAWLSMFAMAASFAFAMFIYLQASMRPEFNLGLLTYGLGLLVFAIIIPERNLIPRMQGTDFLSWALGKGERTPPEFPTRLAALAMLGTVSIALLSYLNWWQSSFWLETWYFFIIAMFGFYWLAQSEALQDLPLLPLAAGLVLIILSNPLVQGFPSENVQNQFTVIVLMALVIGLSSAIASFYFKRHAKIYGYAAILYPVFIALILQNNWDDPNLASHAAALTALLLAYGLLLVVIYALRHGIGALMTEIAAIACFVYATLIAYRLLEGDAHIAAYFVLTALAMAIAYRFNWRYLNMTGRALSILVVILTVSKIYAIFDDPSRLVEIWVPALVLVGFYGLIRYARTQEDEGLRVHFEGYILALGAALIVLVARAIADYFHIDLDYIRTAWLGVIFFAMAVGVSHRMGVESRLNRLRSAFLWGYIGMAALYAIFAAFAQNPFFRDGDLVMGYPIFNTLLFAYAPIIGAIYYAWRFMKIPEKDQLRMNWWVYILTALLLLELNRQFWQGANIFYGRANSMGETISYTVILLAATALSMWLAIQKRSRFWRAFAIGLLIVTAIKVYFIDLTQTAGIARVLVLFVFGAILLGFNFLDRKLANSGEDMQKTS